MQHSHISKLKIFTVVLINAGNESVYPLLTLDFSWMYESTFYNPFV